MPTVCGILVVAINEFSAIRPVAGPPYGRVADSRDALALGILWLTKMPFNSRRLLFATQTDGLERFPRMCRSSDRMIELQSNARPPQPSWGNRFQRVARTLRGNRFGPFRRRFAGSDGEDRRPAAALRLVPFPAAQSSAVRASPFPTRDGFSIGDSKQNRKQEYDAVTLR